MRINRITNSEYPNFGALIYKPKSYEYLATLGQKALADIVTVEKELADTKFYNLEIRETPVICKPDGDKIYPPFNIDKAGVCLMVRGRCGAQTVSSRIRFDKKSDMIAAHKDITESKTQILRTGKIVKYLDNYAQKTNKT